VGTPAVQALIRLIATHRTPTWRLRRRIQVSSVRPAARRHNR
jgi:hypothetical protein